MDDNSLELVSRCRAGDQGAEVELFNRYLDRLIALVKSRISPKLVRRVDPEDVVQSAYRSFFSGLQKDRLVIERSGDLWRLLAAIALHKLLHQVEKHKAEKRTVFAEQSFAGNSSLFGVAPEQIADDPSPSAVVGIIEELEAVMATLDGAQRQMVELRLQGYTLEEVAEQTGRSERTVRRLLDKLKVDLEQRLLAATAA